MRKLVYGPLLALGGLLGTSEAASAQVIYYGSSSTPFYMSGSTYTYPGVISSGYTYSPSWGTTSYISPAGYSTGYLSSGYVYPSTFGSGYLSGTNWGGSTWAGSYPYSTGYLSGTTWGGTNWSGYSPYAAVGGDWNTGFLPANLYSSQAFSAGYTPWTGVYYGSPFTGFRSSGFGRIFRR
jgi:hypothetical protein